jgi:hypothetical protein
MMLSLLELSVLAAVYAAGVASVWALNARALRRSAEKRARYKALPWWYRAVCPVLVVPLFTVVPLLLFGLGYEVLSGIVLLVAAPGAMLVAEIGAVRWYRKAGLWSAE